MTPEEQLAELVDKLKYQEEQHAKTMRAMLAALAAQRKAEEERDEARAIIADVCSVLDVGRTEPFDVNDLAPVAKRVFAMAFDAVVKERTRAEACEKALANAKSAAAREVKSWANAAIEMADEARKEAEAKLTSETEGRRIAEERVRVCGVEIGELRARLAAFEAQSNVVTDEDRARIPKEGSI